jgi:hypothetical protein
MFHLGSQFRVYLSLAGHFQAIGTKFISEATIHVRSVIEKSAFCPGTEIAAVAIVACSVPKRTPFPGHLGHVCEIYLVSLIFQSVSALVVVTSRALGHGIATSASTKAGGHLAILDQKVALIA